MDLEIDDTQRAIVGLTTQVCVETGGAPIRAAMSALGKVGAIGPRHPEPAGAGLTPVESVLVFEAFGAELAPAAGLLWADLAGRNLPKALSGNEIVTGGFGPDGLVGQLMDADHLILVGADGIRSLDPVAVSASPVISPDPTFSLHTIEVGATGEIIADAATAAEWGWQARLLGASYLVGVAQGALDLAVGYAKDREQFGRSIGSFQAVKHMLAEVWTEVEFARSQTLLAAVSWADDRPGVSEAAGRAYLLAAPAAVHTTEVAIQTFGGIGFTVEAQPHRFFKRALAIEALLGGTGGIASSSFRQRVMPGVGSE